VRNVIDWHFRALFRNAREGLEEQGIMLGDPFTRLRWPETIREKPFTSEARDAILAYFRTGNPRGSRSSGDDVVVAEKALDLLCVRRRAWSAVDREGAERRPRRGSDL
jgi:hypothetical protein